MYKFKIIFILMLMTAGASLAWAQQNPDNLKVEEASGLILKVNAQDHIVYLNSFGNQMAFSIPKDAVISRETLPATINDLRVGDSASIRYYSSSEAIYVVMSINDSKAITVMKIK